MAPGEAEWTENDRLKVLAYMQWKGSICPNCGTRNEDWVDERGRLLDEPKYEAATYKCYGCEQLDMLREQIPSGQKGVYAIPKEYDPNDVPEIVKRKRERELMELGVFEEGP